MITPTDRNLFESKVSHLHVMVIGDLMLDRYLWGSVSRISPEAPVPVVDVSRSENRPGGAANVALNLKAMGANVTLAGVLGNDDEGEKLRKLLMDQGFNTDMVLSLSDRVTTTKTRVIGNRQQMLRVDSEQRDTLSPETNQEFLELAVSKLEDIDVLIFEDYDKGVLSPYLIQELIKICVQKQIPTIVDPKFKNFFAYQGCTLFKPNLKELNDGLGLLTKKDDLQGLAEAARQLQIKMPHQNTLITLSENGVLAINPAGEFFHIPAHFRKITDVSGAGDTVVALMGLALGLGLPLPTAAAIANLGGGLVCEEVGVIPVDRSKLLQEM